MLDGYTTTKQIQQISRYFWTPARDSGKSLRNLLAFLLSHYALMRGESARMMELADLHSIVLENEGYSPCRALVIVMRPGKTNQVGRIEVGACMRNKDVEICPHGLLAFYLFWRWHVEGETFPDSTSSERWYPIKLLKSGKTPTKEMTYKVHNKAITEALKHVGVQSKAKTHVGRGSGSRMADLGGASESQIRRLGRWNNQSMEKCYLTSLPREAMRTLAGFEPSRGSFFIARAAVDPPLNLQSVVFPQVEIWQQAVSSGNAEQSIATGGFLELLQYLRKVLLQDAVFLQQVTPKHPIWQHDIFASSAFLKFKREVVQTVSNIEDPAEQRLQKAVPVLNAKIDGVHQPIKSQIGQVGSTLQAIEGDLMDVMRVLAPLQGGTATLQEKLLAGSETATDCEPSSAPPRSSSADPELPVTRRYKMRRGLESVPELWNEWYAGVNGSTAVRDLEAQFGTKWCDPDERRFFNRRRPIFSLVEDIAASLQNSFSLSVSDSTRLAVESVENCRRTQKKSLNWIAKNVALISDDAKAAAIAQVMTRPTSVS